MKKIVLRACNEIISPFLPHIFRADLTDFQSRFPQRTSSTSRKSFNQIGQIRPKSEGINSKIILLQTLMIVILICCTTSGEAAKARDVKEGNRLYNEGKYKESLEKYKNILKEDSEKDIINFDTGTAYYKTEDYENAITHFRKALLGQDESLKANAYYNLGNSFYKLGLNKEEKELESAVKFLGNSLGEYKKALNLSPEDKAVKSNHAFVSKELKRLKEKLKKQQEKNKKSQSSKKENKEKQDKSSGKGQKKSGNSQKNQNKMNNEEKKGKTQESQNKEKKDNGDQKGQNQKQEEQTKSPEQNAVQQPGDQEKNQKKNQGQAGNAAGSQKSTNSTDENTKKMSDQEYQMFLENYQQNEEPKGLLNMQPRSIRIKEVDKDW